MTIKIRIPRTLFSGPHPGMTALAAGAAGRGATFSATLADCMDDWVVQETPRSSIAPSRAAARKPRKEANPGGLARAFSWLRSKYALNTTKRLRVAETVSLGEKRFVALVCVEGREFLIGGGSSGVCLLTPLDSAKSVRPADSPDEGDAE
jgi:flagellar biosynthesis protein FliO